MTLLAEIKSETLSEAKLLAFVRCLSDLTPDALVKAFSRAEVECERFPSIPKLRELAGGSVRSAQAAEADAAWVWLNAWLRAYGATGQAGVRLNDEGEVRPIPAPALPDRIQRTLCSMARGVRDGLNYISDCPLEHVGFVRREFDEAYRRHTNTTAGSALEVTR